MRTAHMHREIVHLYACPCMQYTVLYCSKSQTTFIEHAHNLWKERVPLWTNGCESPKVKSVRKYLCHSLLALSKLHPNDNYDRTVLFQMQAGNIDERERRSLSSTIYVFGSEMATMKTVFQQT